MCKYIILQYDGRIEVGLTKINEAIKSIAEEYSLTIKLPRKCDIIIKKLLANTNPPYAPNDSNDTSSSKIDFDM